MNTVNAKLFAIRGDFIALQNFQLSSLLDFRIKPTELPGF